MKTAEIFKRLLKRLKYNKKGLILHGRRIPDIGDFIDAGIGDRIVDRYTRDKIIEDVEKQWQEHFKYEKMLTSKMIIENRLPKIIFEVVPNPDYKP